MLLGALPLDPLCGAVPHKLFSKFAHTSGLLRDCAELCDLLTRPRDQAPLVLAKALNDTQESLPLRFLADWPHR